jgi:hypothetical protein
MELVASLTPIALGANMYRDFNSTIDLLKTRIEAARADNAFCMVTKPVTSVDGVSY